VALISTFCATIVLFKTHLPTGPIHRLYRWVHAFLSLRLACLTIGGFRLNFKVRHQHFANGISSNLITSQSFRGHTSYRFIMLFCFRASSFFYDWFIVWTELVRRYRLVNLKICFTSKKRYATLSFGKPATTDLGFWSRGFQVK